MRFVKRVVLVLSILLAASTTAAAADFDWIKDFNFQAQADPSGFRAGLATRFKIGDAQISAVIGNVPHPSDAYMVFRLGEMSRQPPERALDVYKKSKGKGWGAMAQDLGIKPGSADFHALKKGHDFDRYFAASKTGGKDKDKDKGGKDKDKDKDKDKGKGGKGKAPGGNDKGDKDKGEGKDKGGGKG
jgi:hypothetical protein